MSALWNILGVITALLVVVFSYFKWTYLYWKRKNIPYIEARIPFGSVDSPFKVPLGNSIYTIYKEAKAKGYKYCGIYNILSPELLVIDLDLVKHILAKDFQYFTDRGVYMNEKDDPVGCTLFSLSGQKWRTLRAKLTPTFTSGKLKAMFQTLVDCGEVLEKYIEENIKPDEPVDIKSILSYFATDVIGSCAFGIDCNCFKEPDSIFRRYGKKIFLVTRIRAIRMLFTQSFPDLARFLHMKSLSEDIAQFFTKLVKDTVEYREKNNVVRKDFLQLLIDLRNGKEGHENDHSGDGKPLTLEEMIAQSVVFFAAGLETSSTTMTFTLFELALHQDIQNRLRAEINEVLAKHDQKITYDSLNEMKYMTQVINETLRFHSVARTLMRLCIKDYKVPGEDFVIEKDTKVFISVMGFQHDEDYWEDPEKFIPERFSDENRKNINQYAHMPFGQGPRACIGERFGLMQVKVGLTSLLRKFKVTLNKKTKLPLKITTTQIVSTAEGGIWLNLEKI